MLAANRTLLAILLLVLASPSATLAADPVPVIFDTDMDSDCDDAGALALLHALADKGEATILATPVSTKHRWSPACVDAINTYFGRPDLPIGAPPGKGPKPQASKYAKQIASEFPHDTDIDDLPSATDVYRKVLAAQPDRSVVIVTVGDLTNLRDLLESKPDEHSKLDGLALVRAKVKQWVCMGSRYPADLDPQPWGNFKMDPEATVRAIEAWPTLITFTGGGKFAESVATGAGLAHAPKKHPARRAYELYFDGATKDRHSADQIAVMVAVRGTGKPWKLVTEGHNHIFANGTHQWRTTPDNPLHEYISALAADADADDVAASIEALMAHSPAEN